MLLNDLCTVILVLHQQVFLICVHLVSKMLELTDHDRAENSDLVISIDLSNCLPFSDCSFNRSGPFSVSLEMPLDKVNCLESFLGS